MALAQQVPNLGLARFSVQDKSILITARPVRWAELPPGRWPTRERG